LIIIPNFDVNLDQLIRNAQTAQMSETEIDSPKKKTRIQQRREKLVLDCALEAFASNGFNGTTIDQIAAKADLSKPNVLYYFKSKEDIYASLLERTLDGWLDPFIAIEPSGEPIHELTNYISKKMDISFDSPLPSRLFAMEVMSGAPHLMETMKTSLRAIVDEKAAVLQNWMEKGLIKHIDPHHLIFSIWSVTQHYADFAVQIESIFGKPPNRAVAKEAVLEIFLGSLKI
jgi:TetR/AcrR family transcriptional regulator